MKGYNAVELSGQGKQSMFSHSIVRGSVEDPRILTITLAESILKQYPVHQIDWFLINDVAFQRYGSKSKDPKEGQRFETTIPDCDINTIDEVSVGDHGFYRPMP